MSLPHCPACNQPLGDDALTLWDNRTYCRACVRKASPELLELAEKGSPLEEHVPLSSYSETRQLLYLFRIWAQLFMVLVSCALVWGIIKSQLETACIGMLFLGVGCIGVCVLLLFIAQVIPRPDPMRSVWVEAGKLHVDKGSQHAEFELTNCTWRVGDPRYWDMICAGTDLRHAVIIETADDRIGVGHDRATYEMWKAFLELAEYRRHTPERWLRGLFSFLLGAATGGFLGWRIGLSIDAAFNRDGWYGALGLIGLIEGGMLAYCLSRFRSPGSTILIQRARPVIIGMVFLMVGIRVGFFEGWRGGLLCGTLNGLLGFAGAWLLGRYSKDPPESNS